MIRWLDTADLGFPDRVSYSIASESTRMSSDSERDPASSILYNITAPLQAQVSWTWTQRQMDFFVEFYENTLYYGVKSFEMPVWYGGKFELRRCQFLSGYSAKALLSGWSVSATLVIQSGPAQLYLPPGPTPPPVVGDLIRVTESDEVRVTQEDDIRVVSADEYPDAVFRITSAIEQRVLGDGSPRILRGETGAPLPELGYAPYFGDVVVKTIELTDYFTNLEITTPPYLQFVRPIQHGFQSAITQIDDGTGHGQRYPSSLGIGQWLYWFAGTKGLLILTNEKYGAQVDFFQAPYPNTTIDIRFSGAPENSNNHEVLAIPMTHDLDYMFNLYKLSAKQKVFWPAGTPVGMSDYRIMALHYPDDYIQTYNFLDFFTTAGGDLRRKGLWMTQWRDKAFDVGYPRYRPGSGSMGGKTFAQFSGELEGGRNTTLFPYFNFTLIDETLTDAPGFNPDWALIKQDGSRYRWGSGLPNLIYACPHSPAWQDTLFNEWDALRKADGSRIGGVYADVLHGAYQEVCWATNHGHEPGDVYSWVRGARQLTQRFIDAGARVFGEIASEVYFDQLSGNLNWGDTGYNFLYSTQRKDHYRKVYGELNHNIGFNFPLNAAGGRTAPYNRSDAQILADIIDAETNYGKTLHGTPCFDWDWQTLVTDGAHPLSLAKLLT